MSTPASTAFLLVPGLSCSPRLFAPQLSLLWQWGSVTVATTTQDDSIPAMARRILADAPPRFVLMGLSMGGYISMEILRQAPERVIAVALLDTSALADTPEASENRLRAMELARQGRMELAVQMNYPRSVHPDRHQDQALQALVQQMAEETGVPAYLRQQTAIMARINSLSSLAQVQCPALVVVGDSDALTPPARAQEIADAIPGAELAVIARCGHLCTLEEPEAVNQVLKRWLTQRVLPATQAA